MNSKKYGDGRRKEGGRRRERQKAKEEKERRRKKKKNKKNCALNSMIRIQQKERKSAGEIGEWINFIASSSSYFKFQVIIELMFLLDGFFLDLELFR